MNIRAVRSRLIKFFTKYAAKNVKTKNVPTFYRFFKEFVMIGLLQKVFLKNITYNKKSVLSQIT